MRPTRALAERLAVCLLQRPLVHLGWWLARLSPRRTRHAWVVGTVEAAAIVRHAAMALPGAVSVNLVPSPFYDLSYTYSVCARDSRLMTLWKQLVGAPLLLGRLAASSTHFLYVGRYGFLFSSPDQREFEFSFLKRRGCRIACLFCGSDIRAPLLMRRLQEQTGLENIATHLPRTPVDPFSAAYDAQQREVARVAEAYAEVIITASVDQLGHLTSKTLPYIYLHPDELFHYDFSRFTDLSRPRLLHAPSNTAIKGTSLVRAAIAQLRSLGYSFDYIELIGVPNSVVLDELRRTHIVLNEFYAFVPGIFGIEALASGCVLMTSADENVEPDLPRGSNRAWIVTRYDRIAERLQELLDTPGRLAEQARFGQQWALQHAAISRTGPHLRHILEGT